MRTSQYLEANQKNGTHRTGSRGKCALKLFGTLRLYRYIVWGAAESNVPVTATGRRQARALGSRSRVAAATCAPPAPGERQAAGLGLGSMGSGKNGSGEVIIGYGGGENGVGG